MKKKKIYSPLIWIGGKNRLLDKIVQYFPQSFNQFYDPFVGGGSISFYMASLGKKVYLSDQNVSLICFYQMLKRNPEELFKFFSQYVKNHSKSYFNRIKNTYPFSKPIEIAAHFLYLNRASFGGIYRESQVGALNIQVRTSKVTWVTLDDLLGYSQKLQQATILRQNFDGILNTVKPKDLVYFDPPYLEFNAGDKRAVYQAGGFNYDQQVKLAELWHHLTKMGVYCCQSNSYSELLLGLYPKANFYQIPIKYKVTGQSVLANDTFEYLLTNYNVGGITNESSN